MREYDMPLLTTIREIAEASPTAALLLPATMPLDEAIAQFAADHTAHNIFLVDEQNHLVGVINNRALLNWSRLQFDQSPREAHLPVGLVRQILNAQTIGDLAIPDSYQLAISMDDSLFEAFNKMSKNDLEVIAVIDEEGTIINDLRLSEVLKAALDVYHRIRGSGTTS